jgi:hypothetical protein
MCDAGLHQFHTGIGFTRDDSTYRATPTLASLLGRGARRRSRRNRSARAIRALARFMSVGMGAFQVRRGLRCGRRSRILRVGRRVFGAHDHIIAALAPSLWREPGTGEQCRRQACNKMKWTRARKQPSELLTFRLEQLISRLHNKKLLCKQKSSFFLIPCDFEGGRSFDPFCENPNNQILPRLRRYSGSSKEARWAPSELNSAWKAATSFRKQTNWARLPGDHQRSGKLIGGMPSACSLGYFSGFACKGTRNGRGHQVLPQPLLDRPSKPSTMTLVRTPFFSRSCLGDRGAFRKPHTREKTRSIACLVTMVPA